MASVVGSVVHPRNRGECDQIENHHSNGKGGESRPSCCDAPGLRAGNRDCRCGSHSCFLVGVWSLAHRPPRHQSGSCARGKEREPSSPQFETLYPILRNVERIFRPKTGPPELPQTSLARFPEDVALSTKAAPFAKLPVRALRQMMDHPMSSPVSRSHFGTRERRH
jgi:hypothetical protein